MTHEKKMAALAELFEMEISEFTPATELSGLSWDSMARLSFMALVQTHFSRKLTGEMLRGFTTVQELLDVMQ